MKQLLLMRHAKSSWKDASLPDEERPLNKRGREAARFMGRYLREHDLVPDAIVCSSAVRANDTAKRVAKGGKFDTPTAVDALYLSGAASYLEVIGATVDNVRRLLVIGHNPDSEMLISKLTGANETMPTGAVAIINVHADSWAAFAASPKATLSRVLRPKELQG